MVVAAATFADAFLYPQGMIASTVLRRRPTRISNKGGMQMQVDEAPNRQQRRMQKKAEKQRRAEAGAKGFSTPQDAFAKMEATGNAGFTVTPSAADEPAAAPALAGKPKSLDDLRMSSAQSSEVRLVTKAVKTGEKPELAGYEELRKVDPAVLSATENFLQTAVLLCGGTWVLAGMSVAIDAYMVATKREVPAGFDDFLSRYMEPFLTPGIVGVFLLSALLGVLQFYKFEGGKSGKDELNQARAYSNRAKRRSERGGGGGPLG